MKVAKEILRESVVIGCAYVALLIDGCDTETITNLSSNTVCIIGILIVFNT